MARTYTRPTMVTLLERTSRAALDLLFPPRCALCGSNGSMLCDDCIANLPPADGDRCHRCWTPLAHGGLCAHCSADREISFTAIRAPFVMEEGARSLVHQLKYGGMSALGEPMGALLAASLEAADADLVVPVPLHRGRMRTRGYNQAALLGRRLALIANLPFDAKAASRIRATKPLARSMHREERRAIVAGAFAARPEGVDGRRVLLVDDVVTTGATLDACARALLAAGAASVRCITFARAD
jgi:ComF family protein